MRKRKNILNREISSQVWFFYLISCLIVLTLFMYIISIARSDETPIIHPQRTAKAMRINPRQPRIDGILDDEIWTHAPVYGELLQNEPDEGQPATEKTEFQIAYDDEALYVGIMCYDREPDKIVARLDRRDGWVESDRVRFSLDAHHDHKTGNWFSINAAGVKQDAQLFNDTGEDMSWDGVWEGETAINGQGWSAEFKIPFHVIRFSPKEEYIWGMNFSRSICRKNERDAWVLVRKGEQGNVSRFGHIEGINGIHPPKHLEFLPFAVGRSIFQPESSGNPDGRDLLSSIGLDTRYGLSSNISLNTTINPDFGQVEADPASLNLSAFETFYEERRPFFLEGKTIFGKPGSTLFYSRRIGKQPGRFAIPEESEIIDKPDSTTILGAMKLSGKTADGTAFGVMDAVTANEYATIGSKSVDPLTGLEQVKRDEYLIEPLSNFFVGRVKQDMAKDSSMGAMLTAVNRDGDVSAYTGAVDGSLKWGKDRFSASASLSGSRSGAESERKSGYEAVLNLNEWSKWIGGGLNLNVRSPGFNCNDLGFMDRAGVINSFSFIHAQINKPWLFARKTELWTCQGLKWNYDGDNIEKWINFFNMIEFKNNWGMDYLFSRNFRSFDDTTTRGGPVIVQQPGMFCWVSLWTDGRKTISGGMHIEGSRTDENLNRNLACYFGIGIKPASNMQINMEPSYRTDHVTYQWVKNIEDANGMHYIFGEYNGRVIDLTIRASVFFNPEMSFQFYVQPFLAIGDYENFTELARPKSYDFKPYENVDLNPDFISRSLRSNAVFRWEYNPGSVLFLVWSQSRGVFMEASNPTLNAYGNFVDSITDEGQNVFLIKLSYWLGI